MLRFVAVPINDLNAILQTIQKSILEVLIHFFKQYHTLQ